MHAIYFYPVLRFTVEGEKPYLITPKDMIFTADEAIKLAVGLLKMHREMVVGKRGLADGTWRMTVTIKLIHKTGLYEYSNLCHVFNEVPADDFLTMFSGYEGPARIDITDEWESQQFQYRSVRAADPALGPWKEGKSYAEKEGSPKEDVAADPGGDPVLLLPPEDERAG